MADFATYHMPKEKMVGRLLGTVADFSQKKLEVLCDLAEKISGKSQRECFRESKKFLRRETARAIKAKIWQGVGSVWLGTFPNINSLEFNLARVGCRVTVDAEFFLKKLSLANMFREIKLVLATPENLGFKNVVTLRQILEKAIEMGLKLCPAEVAPLLAFQCLEEFLEPLLEKPRELMKEPVYIAMDPVVDSGYTLRIFMLERDRDFELDESQEVLWLKVEYGELDTSEFYPEDQFVFATCK